MRIIKFLITGAIGISVNLGVFHVLYILGVPYLVGSMTGLLISMGVGFVLQKYWTFEEPSSERARSQFVQYALLALGNLALNTGIVYVLVDKLGMYYLLAQTIGAATIAIDSFFIYRAFIFKPHEGSSEAQRL